jgi:hypothetical protein
MRLVGRLVLIVALAFGFYTLGRNGRKGEIDNLKKDNSLVRLHRDELQKKNATQSDEIRNLTAEIKKAKAENAELFHPSRTVEIITGESKFISVDQLTIALNGAPRNDGVDLNINDKQQTKVAGDSITVSTTCRLVITKIDLQKQSVTINSSCSPTQQP